MFKKIIFILSLCIAPALYADAPIDEQGNIVKQEINAYMQANKIPGVAVELIVNGKPTSYYFGFANQEQKTPVTKDTIFELGSISKVMTSLLLAEQVDAGKMQLNDDVTKYVPGLSDNFDDISLLDLATHTSGLPMNTPDTIKSIADLKKYLLNYNSDKFAEDNWQYSNFGIGLLGLALETSTHQTINNLYIKNILIPLHMQPIGISVPEKLKINMAQGYDEKTMPVISTQFNVLPAGWGVKASSEDMQKFLAAAIGLRGTPEPILYPMRLTQVNYVKLEDKEQGLGWEINASAEPLSLEPETITEMDTKAKYDGDKLIDKTGMTKGFRAYIALVPNKASGIVILTNRSAMDSSIIKVARKILFKTAKTTGLEDQTNVN